MTHSFLGRDCTYTVDSRDVIDSVDANWLDFAAANGAPDLTEEAVVGQSLFRFLAGQETRHLYRIILDKVRRDGQAVVLPFRCDGPSVRRFMELELQRLSPGGVRFVGRLLREEFREHIPLFDPTASRVQDSIAVCPWCKLVSVGDDWLEVETAVARLGAFEATRLPRIEHRVCHHCDQRLAREASGSH